MDQPRNGACVVTAAGKWTFHEGLLSLISASCEPLGLPTLVKLDKTRVRIMLQYVVIL